MTRKKEHPADGLYYLDLELLERAYACSRQRARWQSFFGRKRVPITLAVLRKMHNNFNRTLGWGAAHMRARSKISDAEIRAFDSIYFSMDSNSETERRAFMDLLATRARREGRLA